MAGFCSLGKVDGVLTTHVPQKRKNPGGPGSDRGAGGGTRTHTLLRAADFESAASTIPPLRRGREV